MKRRFSILLHIFLLLALALLVPACGRQPQPARTEEITFQSGEFTLVGDLRTPAGTGPFPVVLFVHGSGVTDRTMFGLYLPIMERMQNAGYAVFSWDEPTDQLNNARVFHQRAQIVLDAIEVIKERPDIAPERIGLWGISQGGYVMPLALAQSDDIAFMICVSCAGVSGDDQFTFQVIFQAICAGLPEKEADLRRLLSELDEARTFETYAGYLHYRQVLDELTSISPYSQEVIETLSRYGKSGAVPEEAWLENDPEKEWWWNPVEGIEKTTIPILVVNGDKDTNMDPIQGVYAWRKALEQAGNQDSRVELLPGVSHFMTESESTCIAEQMKTFETVLQEQGYGSLEEAWALIQREPGKHTPLSALPSAPAYLDLIEEWLTGLRP
jgi:hypothetical protein